LFLTAQKAKARYMFFLTGTPVYASAGDLWPLLNLIDRPKFGSYWKFVREWAFVEYNGFGHTVSGVKNPSALNALLRRDGYMLRRLKVDVLPELPPKTRMPVHIDMTPGQKAAYRQMAKDLVIEVEREGGPGLLTIPSVLALFTRLRQLLVSPKILGLNLESAVLTALREELDDTDDAALVFTPYVAAFKYIAEALPHRQKFYVHGGQTPEELSQNVNGFQAYQGPKVLISSVLMGTSWTATSATLAYFLGYDWSPANNIQAEDRLHRVGQQNATTVKYFVHRGTIDEHIMDILDGKTRIARLILDLQKMLFPKGG
jgi:SNF2 family DNA or RNA helicase